METIYLCIVIFLLCLAVFDLFVGVSNDAVNFLQSAVGARVASFRTILIIASVGVMLGAVMSSGMMDVARHGIMMPAHYSFHEVMTIMLAVMVTDIIVLDAFNTLGMPTSTTVSLVFELLGGTAMLALLKVMGDPTLEYADLINSDKALQVIIAIFVSVAISFVIGMVVMWLSRIVFTFHYSKHSRYSIAIFGGIAFTALSYFIFMKGMGKSPYLPENLRDYIEEHTNWLLLCTFLVSTVAMQALHLLRVNIFKFTVLMGTFGLAMAFAGNDLVNFIGVPLAGLDSYQDFTANAHGETIDTFMMSSLMESATTTPLYLILAGLVMIFAMATSKKAQHVIQTSVDLSRQDEGDEMFGSSRAARAIVRCSQNLIEGGKRLFPAGLRRWVGTRFNTNEVELQDDKAAFDVVRAAINLVIASMLITFGTNHQLPLSTTYVTFMVAMGTSLADRAWSRESAVFRVTGVLSVIGGRGLHRLRPGLPRHVVWRRHRAVWLHGARGLPPLPQQPPVQGEERQGQAGGRHFPPDDAHARPGTGLGDAAQPRARHAEHGLQVYHGAIQRHRRGLCHTERAGAAAEPKEHAPRTGPAEEVSAPGDAGPAPLAHGPGHRAQHVVPRRHQQRPAVRLHAATHARPHQGARRQQLQPAPEGLRDGV